MRCVQGLASLFSVPALAGRYRYIPSYISKPAKATATTGQSAAGPAGVITQSGGEGAQIRLDCRDRTRLHGPVAPQDFHSLRRDPRAAAAPPAVTSGARKQRFMVSTSSQARR